MHPPEAADSSEALQFGLEPTQRAQGCGGERRARAALTVLLMIRQERPPRTRTHTCSPAPVSRAQAAKSTPEWHETALVVCTQAYRMDDNWIEGRRREEVRMRRRNWKKGRGEGWWWRW